MRTLIVFVAFTLAALGQRHRLGEFDTEKPEGQLLQQGLQENDPAKRAALLEQFAQQYPKSEHIAFALDQLQQAYVKTGQADQILAAGERLLAVDAGDAEAALQCLKAAEAKKDVALIRKYSDLTYGNARRDAAAPQPADAAQAEQWKKEADYARQVAVYADYALFRAAAEAGDPKTTAELGEALAQRSPDSEYLPKMANLLFLAYRQTGANDKALALAEKTLATDQSQPDMLLVVANSYLDQKKNPEKVHAYTAKVVEIMGAKQGDAGASMMAGFAEYLNGKQYMDENQFTPADGALRKALPALDANGAVKAEILFLLGLANYKLAGGNAAKAQDSANYFKACAAIKSPYQATAAANLKRITTEYHGIK